MSQTDSKCCCGSKSCTSEPCTLAKNYFLLRRLHSLSGILPVGLFVIVHLFTNFQILIQQFPWLQSFFEEHDIFQHEVNFIHSLPALLFIEIGLWAAIAFHALLGLAYTKQWKNNTAHYKYMNNQRYAMQRITGVIALIFIFMHIATLRWHWNFFGWFTPFYSHGPNGQPLVTASTAYALQASWLVSFFYLIGALSVVYHWCNGLWTAAITWGVTITPQAQKRWGRFCLALGLVLALFSVGAVVGANLQPVHKSDVDAIMNMSNGVGPAYGEGMQCETCPIMKEGQMPVDCPMYKHDIVAPAPTTQPVP